MHKILLQDHLLLSNLYLYNLSPNGLVPGLQFESDYAIIYSGYYILPLDIVRCTPPQVVCEKGRERTKILPS